LMRFAAISSAISVDVGRCVHADMRQRRPRPIISSGKMGTTLRLVVAVVVVVVLASEDPLLKLGDRVCQGRVVASRAEGNRRLRLEDRLLRKPLRHNRKLLAD